MTLIATTPIDPAGTSSAVRRGATALLLTLLGGCAGLLPKAPPQPAFYALDSPAAVQAAARPAAAEGLPVLIVEPIRAAAGYDSARIIYLRTPLRLEYYAQSEWVDTPARLLAPLLVSALEHSGAFGAVTMAPGSGAGDLRLNTELLRLQHDFTSAPSKVHVTLRASLLDQKTRRVLAVLQFDRTAAADSEDAYGGVVAANRAVQAVLGELAVFVADESARWAPPLADTAVATPGSTSAAARP